MTNIEDVSKIHKNYVSELKYNVQHYFNVRTALFLISKKISENDQLFFDTAGGSNKAGYALLTYFDNEAKANSG
jgi:hypothetical protein